MIKFGDWIVDDDGISNEKSDYYIGKGQLFDSEIYEDSGIVIWDWLIHIGNSGWVTKESVKDFNIAFVFAQDFFKDEKLNMTNLDHVSLSQSLFIQQQLIEIGYKSNSKFERAKIKFLSQKPDK